MKVGFDLSPFSDQATFGVCSYGLNLLKAMARTGELEMCLLLPWPIKVGADEIHAFPAERIKFTVPFAGGRWWEQALFPLRAWAANCDLTHSLANVAPGWSGTPKILTLHDVITYETGSNVSAETMKYLRSFGTRGVKNAAAIITVSEFSKREIMRFFHLDGESIFVVPNGVNEAFTATARTRAFEPSSPYLLGCGSLAPHKNLKVTLQALARITQQFPDARLGLFSVASGSESTILELAKEAGVGPEAIDLLHVPDEGGMARLFANADVLLFPSQAEGFGLPIVEAFCTGLPVVTSRLGATAEVGGDAALLIDPNDPVALADAAIAILRNAEARESMRVRGRQRATLYTWDRAAQLTLAVYKTVYESRVLRTTPCASDLSSPQA